MHILNQHVLIYQMIYKMYLKSNLRSDSSLARADNFQVLKEQFSQTVQLPVIPAKVFVLKHVFEEVSTLGDDEEKNSDWYDHFGYNWSITVFKTDNHLSMYIAEESRKLGGELKTELIGRNADNTEKKLTVTLPVVRELPFKTFGCTQMLDWDKLGEYTIKDRLYTRHKTKRRF
ncbi:hypothetical protein CAEBREN_19014 [Caenorhabditis brenneri]|uniref:MATH domain-containing protein n=1 Tax=Caenorhabditis brenneri TaxID=135651 RepID=G0NW85_CAEBE|nr:hypothetical protein CAEBREN_19014 [Caenorhabditis brenneri]